MLQVDLYTALGEPLMGEGVAELIGMKALDSGDPAAALDDGADPVPGHGVGMAELTKEYTLNCSVTKEVPAGKSVAFEMEVDIPGNLPATDSLVLLWWLGTSQNIQALPVKEPIRLGAPAG